MSKKILEYIESGAMKPDDAICVWCVSALVVQNYDTLSDGIVMAVEMGVSALRLYEILLQSYLFAGFPAAIEGLSVLAVQLRAHGIEFTPPPAEDYDATTFAARGTPLCETIYGGIFQKMSETAISLSPDLYSWMIIEGYGKTLSRNGAPIVLRELATVGILAVLGWQRQLFSHIRGAINVGATADEVLHAVYVCHFLAESKYAVALETFNEAIRKK
ncbi:hypothetical protein MASR2M18_06270 [Ignavibacteria bacterium]|nr:carboxymuconolactone decarboxylase family protein [Bacteroidota bacterium]MCZ2132493.1 carboxymuconolactone decarboxylase family protein [Bacteroidota bacterium]